MKEAFLMGILSMAANADDNDINIQEIYKPNEVSINGKQETVTKRNYVYAITAEDTKTGLKPQIVRHVNF